MQPISSALFTSIKTRTGRILIAEISELIAEGADVAGIATDTGNFLDLRSARTGKVERFEMTKEMYCGIGSDRELGGWEFTPVNAELAKYLKIHIAND